MLRSRQKIILLVFVGIVTICFLYWRPRISPHYDNTYQTQYDISRSLISNYKELVKSENKSSQRETEINKPVAVIKIATNITISESKKSKISGNKREPQAGFDEWLRRRKDGHMDKTILRDLLPNTEFLSTPESPCKEYTPEMIALVQSGCKRKEYRSALRETWGKMAKSLKIPVVFFVAQCPSSKDEQSNYRDIVDVNFVDTYFNITIKSLSRLRWFLEFCPKAEFLLMVDDDALIYIDYLLEYVRGGIGFSIIGTYTENSTALRDKNSKWYQPFWTFPYDKYPPYIAGPVYLVNGYNVPELYNASLNVPYTSVEDALFTGIAAAMVGLHREPDERFPMDKDYSILCGENSSFGSYQFSPEEMKSLWSEKIKECYSERS